MAQTSGERDGSDDGVDVTLIRWMLSLTPEERLAVLQGFVDSVAAVCPGRLAAASGRAHDAPACPSPGPTS